METAKKKQQTPGAAIAERETAIESLIMDKMAEKEKDNPKNDPVTVAAIARIADTCHYADDYAKAHDIAVTAVVMKMPKPAYFLGGTCAPYAVTGDMVDLDDGRSVSLEEFTRESRRRLEEKRREAERLVDKAIRTDTRRRMRRNAEAGAEGRGGE